MKFTIEYTDNSEERELFYIPEDYSFISEPVVQVINFDICVNKIILTVVDKNKVVEVWGYCPYKAWIKADYIIPDYKKGNLKVTDNLEEGFSYGVNENDWPIYVNNQTGWVCIGDPECSEAAVEFMKNCVAVVDASDELVALWLKPQNLPKL